jgi:hypothetical protein
MIQLAPKARQKLTRGKRSARRPWIKFNKHNRALKGRIQLQQKWRSRIQSRRSFNISRDSVLRFSFAPFQGGLGC